MEVLTEFQVYMQSIAYVVAIMGFYISYNIIVDLGL